MKTKKKKLSDSGIRLKPNQPNLLENYSKHIQTRKKKKKKRKKKKSVKQIKLQKKIDPIDKLIQNLNKKQTKIEDIKIKDKEEIKNIKIDNQSKDLSKDDENIKKLKITASIKPDKTRIGGGFIIG
jgi:alpha-galactosidase